MSELGWALELVMGWAPALALASELGWELESELGWAPA